MAQKNINGNYKFPFNIVPVDPKINDELLEYFQGERDGFVQVGPEKYFFPQKYKDSAADYYNFEARPSDIWVASFPRSGTTWTQEMVWLIANDLNFRKAREVPLTQRFPFFEFSTFVHSQVKYDLLKENSDNPEKQNFVEEISCPGYDFLRRVVGQRFIKTHFPFSLLPPSVMNQQCKVIYVARNPKDVAVSYYHLNRLYRTQGYIGDFDRYWSYFERGLNPWMPYWSHVKEAWKHRNHPNVLFLFYEDMVRNLKKTLQNLAQFLGKELTSEGIENLENHLNVTNVKYNSAVNGQEMSDIGILNKGEAGFVRNGNSVDGWQSEYSKELKTYAELWIRENMEKSEICFPK